MNKKEKIARIIFDIPFEILVPFDVYDKKVLGEEPDTIEKILEEYKSYGKEASRYLIKNEPHSEMHYVSPEFQNIWILGSRSMVIASLISMVGQSKYQILNPYKISIYDLDSSDYMEPMDIEVDVKVKWNGEKFSW
jgi:hypothetical protein